MTLADYLTATDQKPSQFAEKLGVPASTILRILTGKREARISTAARIVTATGGKVSFAEIAAIEQAPRDPAPTPSDQRSVA